MGGITLSSNLPALRDAFREFTRYNLRDTEQLARHQTQMFAGELYEQTAAIAPSESQISADVQAQGWVIPARFDNGARRGRGTPDQWLGFAVESLPKKRGRKSKARHAQEQAILVSRPTLEQMQAYVIRIRDLARLYLASGWLNGLYNLGVSPPGAVHGTIDPSRSGAEVRRGGGVIEIELWNRTPGIVTQNQKHQFVAIAVRNRVEDMWVYIREHQAKGREMLRHAA